MARYLAPAALLATLAACGVDREPADGGTSKGLGIVTSSMDRSIRPGDDFFAFANGTWVRNTAIPADRSAIGGFYLADVERERQTRDLLDRLLRSHPAPGSDDARIAAYYRAYLDTGAIDHRGLAPAKADIEAIGRIGDVRQLSAALGRTLRADVDPLNATNLWTENLFGVFVTQGLATPGKTLPYLLQGGLGLPERTYYLSGDPKMVDIRKGYRRYVETILAAASYPDPKGSAERVLRLETRIADAHEPREETEDYTRPPAVWSRAELERKAPGVNWTALLDAAQLAGAGEFQAYNPKSIPSLSALVASEPLQDWKDWLVFHALSSQANVLPAAFRDASFAFYGTQLGGIPTQRARSDLAMNAVSFGLPDAVGKAYVRSYFPASAKAEIQQMVDGIKTAFAERVRSNSWMAASTKAEALKKVESIVVGIGYPDQWRDYSSLAIGDDAYANQKAARLYEYRHQIAKIGKPVDRHEWWMPPQLVNAVNLPVQNALNFPAAILQRPFYDPKADPAFNYGAIGSTIGHEISHSFDDNGAAFDSRGVMRNWWTPADFSRFKAAGEALAAQFDTYEALPRLHVNGKLTLGENISDLAGLAAAYDAYHASLKGREAPVIDGLTGDQRFFLAFGQAWAGKMRDERMRQIVLTNSHAPDRFRALTVRNLDPWYAAFGVRSGDKLYLEPRQRVRIW